MPYMEWSADQSFAGGRDLKQDSLLALIQTPFLEDLRQPCPLVSEFRLIIFSKMLKFD